MKTTKLYPSQDGWLYKRLGKCDPTKCGSFCCRMSMGHLSPTVTKDDPNGDKIFYDQFGYKRYDIKKGPQKGYSLFVPPLVCSKLSICGKCSIHSIRPKVCQDFPASPDQAFFHVCKQAGCTYDFKRVKRAPKIKPVKQAGVPA